MPDLVIKDSDSCWQFKGGTLCNVIINDNKGNESIPAAFVMTGNITGVKGINNCWKDENGNIVCSVKAKGKDGGKNVYARTIFNRHIEVPTFRYPIENSRSMPAKCDPKTDPFCRVD